MTSLFLSIFSSGAGGSQMLKGYYETLRRGQRRLPAELWLVNRGVFPSQTDLALPLVSAGAQFLSSFTLSCVKRGNSQSAQPRAWNEIRVGILAAKPEAGRQAEEPRGKRSAGKKLTFAPHFQQSEDGPATALLPLTSK